MLTGQVMGNATATVRHRSMRGWKLLVVQPLCVDGKSPDGEPVLVIDSIGSGRGDRVMITSDGKGTRDLVDDDQTPIRWSVLGICD